MTKPDFRFRFSIFGKLPKSGPRGPFSAYLAVWPYFIAVCFIMQISAQHAHRVNIAALYVYALYLHAAAKTLLCTALRI